MTDKTSLRQLIEAVEAGMFPAEMTTAECGMSEVGIMKLYDAFSGSLDAAKALHEALLPNRYWTINHWDHAYNVTVPVSGESSHDGFSEDNPARAWLIAILKAYEART